MVVKSGRGVTDEAAGLLRLGAVHGGPRVPAVLYSDESVLAMEWIDSSPDAQGQEEVLGGGLAAVHSVPSGAWGGGSSWIGDCAVDAGEAATAGTFYRGRLLGLARRCGMEPVIEPLVDRLPELIPPGPAALLHGDLWWGNVLWGADGRPAIIDPSVHGGHPEEDLAMLALFGRVPDRLLAAYRERRGLDAGWEERVALWQLYPLLVHTVLFGGSYRAQAEAAARRYS